MLGLTLHVDEPIARRKKIRDQHVASVGRISEIAAVVCGLKCTTHQITASPDMSRPGQNAVSKIRKGPGLETRQTAFFDQIEAESAETVCRLIVAEAGASDHAEVLISSARGVAGAALEAEIGRSAGD